MTKSSPTLVRQLFQVVGKFVGSFQCDQQCGQIEDQDLLDECQKQFCEEEEDDNYEDYYNDVL